MEYVGLMTLTVIAGQVLIVFFGGVAFKTQPISFAYWAFSIVAGALSIPLGFAIRLLPFDSLIQRAMIWLGVLHKEDELPLHRSSSKASHSSEKSLDSTLACESTQLIGVLVDTQ